MKLIIKQEDIAKHNPMASALASPLYRQRIIKSKKSYSRKKKVIT